jgi:elongator complex protein 3
MLKPRKGEVRKPTKTISGITPVAVMLPPRKCKHGSCIYCPNLNVPQSYTPKSPVVLRASQVKYDAYKQVQARLEAFKVMNHPTEKIELIIMGGTFLQYPKKFQYEFVKGLYDGLNSKKSKTLASAQKKNEKAKQRCVALCIETRPDVCVEFIDRMREFGCTRVELGVQILDDKIYDKVNRGHTIQDVVDATKALKDAGFKIGYHIMLGLPGSNSAKDLKLFKKLFSDERFKPDQLKIYPCQVMPGSELERWYWEGKYKPYTKEQIEKLLVKMLKIIPRYCRVMRIMREIPPSYLVAGTLRIDLRKEVEKELREKNTKLKEIRYREIGFAMRDGREVKGDLKLKVTKYKASVSPKGERSFAKTSEGNEYFLEIVNSDDILFGLLRLRVVNGGAVIREVHVYGQSLKLGEKGNVPQGGTPKHFLKKCLLGAQHKGLGKWLIAEAEKIVAENKCNNILIISGIGVREYYKRLGYVLEDTYMVKLL